MNERDMQEKEIRRGLEAERILSEPLLVEAFDYLRATWTKALIDCKAEDFETIQGAKLRLEALAIVERELRHVMTSGTFAARKRDEGDALRLSMEDAERRHR